MEERAHARTDLQPGLGEGAAWLELDQDHRPVLSLTRLTSIGISDLRGLVVHSIVRDAAGTTHQLEFADGGIARVSYSDSGKLRDLVVERCGATVTTDGAVLLSL